LELFVKVFFWAHVFNITVTTLLLSLGVYPKDGYGKGMAARIVISAVIIIWAGELLWW